MYITSLAEQWSVANGSYTCIVLLCKNCTKILCTKLAELSYSLLSHYCINGLLPILQYTPCIGSVIIQYLIEYMYRT